MTRCPVMDARMAISAKFGVQEQQVHILSFDQDAKNGRYHVGYVIDRAMTLRAKGDNVARTEVETGYKGGIDFNAANLNLQIKRDGKGVPLPIAQQNLENINIDGLIPVILEIKPAMATPLLSELQAAQTP